jgi:hypothetical protein
VALVDAACPGAHPRGFAGCEFSWSVDGGLWSRWMGGPRLEISPPLLMLPLHHVIEVRAREAGQPASADRAPARVPFLVDSDPPSLRLEIDRGTVRAVAHDNVTLDDDLRLRWRSGGAWSPWTGARTWELASLGSPASLEVEVRDEAGLSAFAQLAPTAATHAAGNDRAPATRAAAPQGCAQGGAALLALLPVLLRRRRTRRAGASRSL